ncbi:aminotransferase class I/II-fold pyridoxal phosphate-dependent enzyme [Gordonia amicalis]|uniref:aminotransferase class I/II-fold pyridoxal phosphate-dependent enzyme n=1 Tax=Gordonia amicalis TaxID=89053 RepID=UPI0002A623DD|nr:putative decarboxylase [Gordonia amicalis NBRC 100051 = JCM 11271]
MSLDQSRAPLLEALDGYRRENRYGYTPPGHRQGRGVDDRTRSTIGGAAFESDVLASGGLDDRRMTNAYLSDAEELMADAVGAELAFFSTCGSSLSVKAAMMAVAGGEGGELLITRDAHKSIVAGLIFSGLRPRWVRPRWDETLHLTHPPSPAEVRKAWETDPQASGLLIVSPTPYGTCADIRAIADVCHEYGKPLIVDEAWGAHLPFHDELPTWAMDAGADVCVVSVHKMGAGFEQGSVFHVQGDLIDRSRLSRCADLLMTTSPSVPIYAALDGWRRYMVRSGREVLGRGLELARTVRRSVDEIDGLTVTHDELLREEASHDLDEMQVLIDVDGLGVSGYQCADWLREHHCVDLGLSDHRRILATISHADDEDTADRLLTALRDLASAADSFDPPREIRQPSPDELQLENRMLPRDAFFGDTESVSLDEAPGRIAAEQITPYPPGIPVVVPGEVLNEPVVEYLRTGKNAGMNLPDAADDALDTIKVVCRPT